MQNLTDARLRQPLAISLALTGFAAAVAAGLRTQPALAKLVGELLLVLSSYAWFVWYCRDSDGRGYTRSLWRNICFIFFGLLFVPWYLMRTRRGGRRFFPLLKLAGFVLLTLSATIVGALIGALVQALT